MDVLPAIGTIYSSLAAFKLDILERGERLGITYTVRLSKSYLLWLQCNVVLGESPCGHSIQAKKLVSEGGEVKVVSTRGEHTCSQSQLEANFRNPVMLKNREARLKAAKSEVIGTVDEVQEPEMEVKMEDVESTIGRRRISAQIAARKLNTAAREEELEDEEMEEREYEVQDGNEYEPENDEMEERQVGKSGQFSSTEVLRIRAAQLLERDHLLTRLDQQFNSLNIRKVSKIQTNCCFWHAFARQEGFSLVRTSKNASQANLRASCSWNRGGNWYNRCCFFVQAKKSSDGLWHPISSTTLVHNHSSKDQASATSSSATPSISSHTSAFSPHPFIVQAESLSSNARPLLIPQVPLALLPVMPSSSQSHPSDLINFLRSFEYSPSTIFETLSILRVAGVNSLEVLVSLLSMGETTFSRFVNSIGGEIGNRLKLMAKKMREESA
ncbi:hypothetical protein JCM5350_005394 [Sporobolomyces pararoseus]